VSELTAFQLWRYLDYCAELLLATKVASVFICKISRTRPRFAAVNEIEDLTMGLSRKIWQKIMILQGSQH